MAGKSQGIEFFDKYYLPKEDEITGIKRKINTNRKEMRNMKELSLVFFTLMMQASVGTSWGIYLLAINNTNGEQNSSIFFTSGWILSLALAATGLGISFLHLKVPMHAWRGITNLKTSWLSREILFASLYIGSLFALVGLHLFGASGFPVLLVKCIALATGTSMIFCMGSAYRLKTVQFWNSPQTILSFYTTALVLGILLCGVTGTLFAPANSNIHTFIYRMSYIIAILLLMNIYYSYSGYRRLAAETDTVENGIKKMMQVRVWIGIIAVLMAISLPLLPLPTGFFALSGMVIIAILSELSGRILFYAAQVHYGVYLFKG